MARCDADNAARAAFEDSRRLPGPNRWFGDSAVELTALTRAAGDAAALAGWARRVRLLCAALGWPDPQPHVHRLVPAPAPSAARSPAQAPAHAPRQHTADAATLAFCAPHGLLFTATEINEWAWERSSAAQGALAAEGAQASHPDSDVMSTLRAWFGARAADECCPPLTRLKHAAAAHGVPLFDDDDSVSLGAGSGSRCWPRAALPLPMDVPWAALHAVPTLLVTGSNGKTTSTRLLAAMAAAAGFSAGSCSTEGVVVAGHTLHCGDYAGPAGARAVLRHRSVQFAVLETARGGILRRGLAVRRADAALITNVSADHLGEYGVFNVEDIAHAKLVVAHAVAVSGVLVLNGADSLLMAVADAAPQVQAVHAGARLALFARDHHHPRLQAHRHAGGSTCGAHQGRLWLAWAGTLLDLGDVARMPLTLGGAAAHNLENIAAAVLMARAAGLQASTIMHTLAHFGTVPADNPGRLERWLWRGATVLIDYAHNPGGLAQLLGVARALQPRRLGLLLGQAGNRDDAALAELARTAAGFAPDLLVLKELPKMLRGRAPGEVSARLHAALLGSGLPPAQLVSMADEEAAARALLAWARAGDVVVLPVHTEAVRVRLGAELAMDQAADPAANQAVNPSANQADDRDTPRMHSLNPESSL